MIRMEAACFIIIAFIAAIYFTARQPKTDLRKLFSALLVAVMVNIDRQDKVWTICGKIKLPMILLLFILIFGAAQVLNMPVFTVYRFGIYFMSFLIGYYIFSHENVREMTEKIRIPMLCLATAGAVLYAIRYGDVNYASPDCLQSIMTNLYLWVVILAVIGFGRKYFNRETAFTRYMTKSSFGIYVLHYPVLIVTGYILHYHFILPAIWNYIIAFAAELIITFALYELIRRLPIIRYIVLGVKKEEHNDLG